MPRYKTKPKRGATDMRGRLNYIWLRYRYDLMAMVGFPSLILGLILWLM